jgi:hypothetical protein
MVPKLRSKGGGIIEKDIAGLFKLDAALVAKLKDILYK